MKTSIVAGVVVVVVAAGMAIQKAMPKPPANAGKTMSEGPLLPVTIQQSL
jgi:hypothetical protein